MAMAAWRGGCGPQRQGQPGMSLHRDHPEMQVGAGQCPAPQDPRAVRQEATNHQALHLGWLGLLDLDINVKDSEKSNVWARAQLVVGHASSCLAPKWQVAVERPGCPLFLGSRSAPGWPVAAMRPGCLLLLGILQHQLQPLPYPLPSDSIRAFTSAPRLHIDSHPAAYEDYMLNEDQQWDNQGAGHVVQQCGAVEGHVMLVNS